jgi:hypothetical protein
MQDECGDTLWDEVLAQPDQPALKSFGAIAFTPEVRAMQQKLGNRASYLYESSC